MKKIRSYKKLVNELINISTPFQLEILDYVIYNTDIYPILCFKRVLKTANKTVVLLSGQHGDEVFAVNTLTKWIQRLHKNQLFTKKTLFENINFYIYPIVNPFGYEYACRENGLRQDTNNDKSFNKNSQVKELSILYDNYPSNINMIIDIHGDGGKSKLYLYEHKADNLPTIAQQTAKSCNNVLPYLKQKTIYGCKLTNGVLTPPREDIGIEGAIEDVGVEYTITIELPGKFDGQKRIEAGVNVINTLISYFDEVKL